MFAHKPRAWPLLFAIALGIFGYGKHRIEVKLGMEYALVKAS